MHFLGSSELKFDLMSAFRTNVLKHKVANTKLCRGSNCFALLAYIGAL